MPQEERRPAFHNRGSRPALILWYVSETRDKRRRRDLDLFVLALIESGVSTLYELKSAADISPGASIPTLRRLVSEGLVIQGKPGSRGKTDHRVTTAGRRRLKSGWRELIEEGPSGDLDADLRVALLALYLGHDHRLAVAFLRQSAAKRLETVEKRKEPEGAASIPLLALRYRQLRSIAAGELIKGESAAAIAMAKALPRSAVARAGRWRTKASP